MSFASAMHTASRVAVSGYRIVSIAILTYYLIKETVQRERAERRH